MNTTKNRIPKSKDNKKRIAIVDSHATTRIGISQCIKSAGQWDIAWESPNAENALEKMLDDKPDALILEIQLPGKDGLELIKHVKPLAPGLKILVHSSHSEDFYAERCLRAGALGYLPKSDSLDNLNISIERILNGDIYLSPRITRRTIHSLTQRNGNGNGSAKHHDHHQSDLTDRELEIMILMAQGLSAHDSASKLRISPRTVQVHRNNIRLKLSLETALQLHAYAVRFYGSEGEPFLPEGVNFDRRKNLTRHV